MSEGFSDKEIDFVLNKSEDICKELNKVFGEQISGLKGMQMGVVSQRACPHVMYSLGNRIIEEIGYKINSKSYADLTFRFENGELESFRQN